MRKIFSTKTHWFVALLLAAALVFGFASCSSDSDDDDDSSTSQTTQTNTADNSDNNSTDTSSIAEKTLTGREINTILRELCADGTAIKFMPSSTAPASTAVTKSINDEIGAVLWLDGDTIYYYAKGYADSGKGIPLNPSASHMFDFEHETNSLQSIDMTGFDTSNVTSMGTMFRVGSSLTSLNVSKFDTSKCTYMKKMFSYCSSLTSLDLSSFDTSNVTSMDKMFLSCSSLTSLDVSNFDTCNVTDMEGMFSGCSSLTSLNVSKFNTSNVTNMNQMFGDCSALTTLDLSSFDTRNVTLITSMFAGCTALKTIYAASGADWGTSSTTDSSNNNFPMFSGCTSLVGGNGTVYDSSHNDATYARIDGLNGSAGYFTAK